MARVKGALMTRKRRNKVLKFAKGSGVQNLNISKWLNKLL